MPRRRWLNPAEDRAWRGYRRMHALLDLQISRDLLHDSALSDADYDVLSNLSEAVNHRLRLRDLAAHMLWSPSRLSHQISRMQRRGLVKRRSDPADARGAVVVLTDQGWQLTKTAAPPHVASVRRHLIDVLSAEQIDSLGELTEAVVRHLSSGTAPGG